LSLNLLYPEEWPFSGAKGFTEDIMLASQKIFATTKFIAAHTAAVKASIGVGVVASTIVIVPAPTIPPDYLQEAIASVNDAAAAEAGLGASDKPPLSAAEVRALSIDPDTGIPRLTVVAKRMSSWQKAAYDQQHATPTQLAGR
jgi:hypothetical protein